MQSREINIEAKTVEGFGQEWSTYDQSELSSGELETIFMEYFKIFPWKILNPTTSVGADYGCGSGRWAKLVAPNVKQLHLVDASPDALNVARRQLSSAQNVIFHKGSIEEAPIAQASLDFAYSLGVLHHLPDTEGALRDIAGALKPGAPFLVYLYYAFDNRPLWYGLLWRVSNVARIFISRLNFPVRRLITQGIAAAVYWPAARFARLLEKLNLLPEGFPLSYYRNRSFYIMQNDALDRFGTRLEKRYTRNQIKSLLEKTGFEKIRFSEGVPYWCALAYRKNQDSK